MKQAFFYKLTHDSGAAPCVDDGLLSLAICKPMIRTSAKLGDLLFGFAASSLHADNRLIFIARVTEVLPDGRYYEGRRYARRADCIYERRGNRFVRRADAAFHERPGDLEHDLGSPPHYSRATVLLSSDFRYYGANGSDDYKRFHPRIGLAIKGLKRGHRVHHDATLIRELLSLKRRAWRARASGRSARPSNAPNPKISLRAAGCGVAVRERRGC